MNEPYTPFEPQIGGAPNTDENSTIETETTDPSIKFESGETHIGSSTDDVKTAVRSDKYRDKAEEALEHAGSPVVPKRDRTSSRESDKAIFTVLGIDF
jgi:hypothetical protein